MKKYIIALGGLGAIVTPLVSVISCNKPNDKTKIEGKDEVKKIDLVTDKISSYLKTNKNVLLDALKTAREESNNTKEIKENLVANISSGDISNGLMVSLLSFDKELAKFATSEVRKNIVENNLTLIAPKGSLKRKGTYGITWVKGTKTIIESKELEGVNANIGFFGKLDTAMNFGGTINFAITSFSKLEDNVKIIPKLIGMGTFKGQQGEALESLKELDFTAKDFKDIISSVKMIVHNIDADLPAIMASNHKLSSLLKLAKTPNVILNKKEFYEGVSTLINTFADLVLKNKTKVGSVIKAINLFKPGLISETKSKLISAVVESKFFEKFVTNLKTIKPVKVEALGKIILSIIKNNDFTNFSIMKFITKKGNLQNVTELFNTLGISYEDMLKAVIDNFDKIKPLIGFLQPTPKKDEDGKVVKKDGKVVMEDKYALVDTEHIYKLIELLKKESGVTNKDSNDQIIEKLSKLSLSNLINSIIESKILSKWFINVEAMGGAVYLFESGEYTNGALLRVTIMGILGAEDNGEDGKAVGVYFKPILSYDFLHKLESFLTENQSTLGYAFISKFPKGIQLKLKKLFNYLDKFDIINKVESFKKDMNYKEKGDVEDAMESTETQEAYLKTLSPEKQEAFSKLLKEIKTNKIKQDAFNEDMQDGMQNILKLLLKKNSSSEIAEICSKISKNKTISVLLNLLK